MGAATTQDCRFPVVVVTGLLLLLYGREVTEIVYAPATPAGDDLAQVKQALQQDRDKTEKLAGELTTTLAQVKQQAPQQDRDKTEKPIRELTTDLAQVKQALQQDRDRAEKQVRELTTTWHRSSRRRGRTETRPRSRSAR